MPLFEVITLTYKENPALTKVISKVAVYVVNPAIGLMFGIALVFFLYGVFEYFIRSDDTSAKAQGAQHIMWGLIGMVIMFGVYGIIHIITGTFGIVEPPNL